ncbi:MAG: TerB family tellurite resistance protein [Paracoccaceae bacterium]
MFNSLINLFTRPLDEIRPATHEAGILALSALFIRIAKLDGNFDKIEKEKIKELVKNRFQLGEEKTENVLVLAAKLESQSNDNIQFTKIIKESVAYEDRFSLLKDCWLLVMADGTRSYEEDGFMRLFCSLLGLSDKDNAIARQLILKKQGNS